LAWIETDAGLSGIGGFSGVVLGAMGCKTGVSERVPSTLMTTLRGFEISWVGVEKIGALFLATGTALNFTCGAGSIVLGGVVQNFSRGTRGVHRPRGSGTRKGMELD